jgi:hypothetical protein
MIHGVKFCRLCLKLSPPTIPTSSLLFYPYQKDERALPGYLLTSCSFSISRYKAPLTFPSKCFFFIFTSTHLLSFLSLSLSPALKGQFLNQTERILSFLRRNLLPQLLLLQFLCVHTCSFPHTERTSHVWKAGLTTNHDSHRLWPDLIKTNTYLHILLHNYFNYYFISV